MRFVLLDLLASLNGIGIGLAVKPGVIGIDTVHIDSGLAEPAHEAITAVGLGQTFRLRGGILLKRNRRIAWAKPWAVPASTALTAKVYGSEVA